MIVVGADWEKRVSVAVALTALSKYLPRYNRSVARYAQQLTDEAP